MRHTSKKRPGGIDIDKPAVVCAFLACFIAVSMTSEAFVFTGREYCREHNHGGGDGGNDGQGGGADGCAACAMIKSAVNLRAAGGAGAALSLESPRGASTAVKSFSSHTSPHSPVALKNRLNN